MGPFCKVQFGTVVRMKRQMMNWTQDYLAGLTGIAQYTLCRIESGNHEAKAGEVRALKEAFKCSYDDFYIVK